MLGSTVAVVAGGSVLGFLSAVLPLGPVTVLVVHRTLAGDPSGASAVRARACTCGDDLLHAGDIRHGRTARTLSDGADGHRGAGHRDVPRDRCVAAGGQSDSGARQHRWHDSSAAQEQVGLHRGIHRRGTQSAVPVLVVSDRGDRGIGGRFATLDAGSRHLPVCGRSRRHGGIRALGPVPSARAAGKWTGQGRESCCGFWASCSSRWHCGTSFSSSAQ